MFEAPVGRHTLRFVAPASEFAEILPQIELPDGVTLMSYRVIHSRPPVLGELAGPDVITARQTLETLEQAIADKDAESAAIHREIARILTQMTFLETLGSGQPVGTDLITRGRFWAGWAKKHGGLPQPGPKPMHGLPPFRKSGSSCWKTLLTQSKR